MSRPTCWRTKLLPNWINASPKPVPYRYTTADLLAEPCHYTYTPFEGLDFLRSFLEERKSVLEQICGGTAGTPGIAGDSLAAEISAVLCGNTAPPGSALQERRNMVLPARPGEVGFETESVLLDLWHALLFDRQQDGGVWTSWNEVLLKRFEVTKKIFTAYTITLKPAVAARFDRLENYALFAGLLLHLHREDGNLRHLNTTLKLTDLLISARGRDESPFVHALLCGILTAEREAVQRLLGYHQITL